MFNPLTRTLKIGLTALAILIFGGVAGTAFAQSFAEDPVRYCATGTNYINPICKDIVNKPNAANWVKQNPTAPTTPETTNRHNQFLRGTETGVNEGTGLRVYSSERGNLNLSTATFNGVALGGVATNGMAFFMGSTDAGGRDYAYSGLFSGTDLGGPIAEGSGKASWVGRFKNVGRSVNKDFVLEVDYATRSLDAFVHYSGRYHYRLDANYDSTGHITGKFELSNYHNKDRTNKKFTYRTGSVTGLIGQEGAVGAFHSNETPEGAHSAHASNPTQISYAGGFVARPAHLVVGEDGVTAQTFLDNTCNSTNPFSLASRNQEFCRIEYAKDRAAITFADDPVRYCRTGTNHIKPICKDTLKRPNAANWAKQNPTAPTTPETANRHNQFLEGTETELNEGAGLTVYSGPLGGRGNLNLSTATFNGVALGGVATDGVAFFRGWVDSGGRRYAYSGLFSSTDLGGPIAERSGKASWVGRFKSVGRSVDKDFVLDVDYATKSLDAFVQYHNGYHYRLDANYDSTGHITGKFELSNYHNNHRTNKFFTYRTGKVTGLIGQEGAVGAFHSDETPEGAYDASDPTEISYAGGFVARPAHLVVDEDGVTAQTFLDNTCNSTNPFATTSRNQEFCRIEYAKDRAAIIDDCIKDNGSVKISSKCTTAARQYSCIKNPFADKCAEDPDFKDIYVSVRAKRIAFCNNGGSQANDPLCTPSYAVTAICNVNLFGAGCLSRTENNSGYNVRRLRRAKVCAASRAGEAPDPSCEDQGVTLADICTRVPFASVCVGYDDERLELAKRCANDVDKTNPKCDDDYVSTSTICNLVPFGTVCVGDARFDSDREKRITSCNNGGSEAEGLDCTSTEVVLAICKDNPFGADCHSALGGDDALRMEKVNYCSEADNRLNNNCTTLVEAGYTKSILKRPNAANWAKQNPTAPTTPETTNRHNQFLRGTETGVRRGTGLTVDSWDRGNLNLSTATFNGVALGGDATNGVAFFMGDVNDIGREYAYSGLFSGTDLGGPIAERSGKASWVGRIENVGYGADKDFVLEVDYATRSLDAFVHYYVGAHYRLDANYDSTGHITGEFELSFYNNNDRTDKSSNYRTGKVTGLIGQEGAVGAFISDETPEGAFDASDPTEISYAGGFVARPAHLVVDEDGEDGVTAQTFLDNTCNSTNPFATTSRNQEFCYIEYAKDRVAIIDDCIKDDGSVKISSKCTTAARQYSCIKNPFADKCAEDPDFKDIYVSVRAKRIAFCNNGGSQANDPLCTPSYAVTAICNVNLFGAGCLRRTENNSGYNVRRLRRAKVCAASRAGEAPDPSCDEQGVTLADICTRVPFASVCVGYDDERLELAKRCANDVDKTNPKCDDDYVSTSTICNLVPFGGECTSDTYQNQRITQAKTCAGDLNASGCDYTYHVSTPKICELVPFGGECTSDTYQDKRVTQAKTCAGDLNASGCDYTYHVTTPKICELVPFGGECTSDTYQDKRVTQAKTCAGDLNASGCDYTYHVSTPKICELVPFGGECTSDTYQNNRAVQAKTCAGDLNASGCDESYHVSTSTICNLVPFGGECTSDTYQNQRVTQAKTCAGDLNASGCDETYFVSPSTVCELVPFGGECTSDTYQNQRVMQAKTCAGDLNASGCDESYHVSTSKICNLVPFGGECTSDTYENQRIERAKFCTINMSDLVCRGVVSTANICSKLPFHSDCVGYDDERLALAKICANDVDKINPKCDDEYVSTTDICTRVPFASTCDGDTRFNSYREDHITSCNNGGSEAEGLDCTSTKVVVAICEDNLFGTVCLSHTNYDPDRASCNTDGGKYAPACTTPGAITAICEDNLFGVGCLSHTSYNPNRDARIRECNIKANLGNSKCTHPDTVNAVCTANLFGTGCVNSADLDGVYEGKRTARISLCNKESTDANNPLCTPTDVVDAVCKLNLFGVGCSNSRLYDDDREDRIRTCNIAGNVGDAICNTTDAIIAICADNLFGAGCSSHTSYDDDRVARINLCNKESTEANDRDCTPTDVVNAVCEDNLFGTGCLRHTNYDDDRAACNTEGGKNATACRTTGATVAICAENLFGVGCLSHDDYDDDRASCNTDGGKNASACRTSGARAAICAENLFGVGCLTHPSYDSDRIACNTEGGKNATACRTSGATVAICADNLFGVGCSSHTSYDDERAACNTEGGKNATACRTTGATVAICADNLFGVGCSSHTSYDDERAACNTEGGKNATACRTTGARAAICEDNLFGVGCLSHTSYNPNRDARIRECNIKANLGNSKCTHPDTVNAVCTANLFGTGCVNSADLDGVYEGKRTARISLCNKESTDANNPLCTPTDVVDAVCKLNLFGVGCSNSRLYDDDREDRIRTCNIAGNVGDAICNTTDAIIAICADNLFGAGCLSHTSYDPDRVARINLCNKETTEANDRDCTPTDVVNAVCEDNLFKNGCARSAGYSDRLAERISFCNMEANLRDPKCTPTEAVNAVCADNFFGNGCVKSVGYTDRLAERISFCNMEANLRDPKCTPIRVVDEVCADNLFGKGCVSSVGYDARLAERISFCNMEANLGHEDCTPTKVVDKICKADLFGTGCLNNVDTTVSHAVARKNRLELCDTNSRDPLCTGTNLNSICSYAPFSPVCSDRLDTKSVEIVEKFTDCRVADPSDLTCHGVSKKPSEGLKPDAATWLDDFVTIDNPSGLSSVVDTSKGSQFLKATKTGLKQDGIIALRPDVLHLSDVLDGNPDTSNELPSDEPVAGSEDGVAFFYSYSRGLQFAAGILPETDLGAPITRTSNSSAVWLGKFQSVYIDAETFFDLHVNFDNNGTGTIDAFIERKNSISSISYSSSVPHYHLKGDFDAKGRITGQIFAGTFDNIHDLDERTSGRSYYSGVLRGLIGEEGAVGAFVGGSSNDKGLTFHSTGYFAGGFVAVAEPEAPCVSAGDCPVNYDVWVNAARPLKVESRERIRTTRNRFLTTTATALNKGRASGSSIHVTMKTAKYGGVALAGDATDGFAYLRGSVNHVGILANTNLGVPLNAETAEGTWEGSFVSAEGRVIITKDFILDVDFDNETVSATIPTTLYDFEGTFDTWGVIDGTITHTDVKVSNGIMTGLIGSEGAVGVFISNADADLSYGGGFVARPRP